MAAEDADLIMELLVMDRDSATDALDDRAYFHNLAWREDLRLALSRANAEIARRIYRPTADAEALAQIDQIVQRMDAEIPGAMARLDALIARSATQ